MEHLIYNKIKQVKGANLNFIKMLFQHAPAILLDSCLIVKMEKNNKFVVLGEKVSQIYILISGRVNGLEEYEMGRDYIYNIFDAPNIFGEMELLADIPTYQSSLITASDSIFLTIPIEKYNEYLKVNKSVLFHRMQENIKLLLENGKDTRMYLMIDASDRLKLYLIQRYDHGVNNNTFTLKTNRKQMADETGYSVKTINRIIKKLESEKNISISGHNIIITLEQFNIMKDSLKDKININKFINK